MTVSKDYWIRYVEMLREVNDKAADLLMQYISSHDVYTDAGRDELIEYAYALATKYGDAAAELSCQMYDALAALSGKQLPPAEPAATAGYNEVAKAVNGTLTQYSTPEVVSSAVGRLVKRAGVDTTMKNAIRDGAEWAWIPVGDTCAFCLTLASRGWQRASKKALKGGHAEHIHANCDCTYAIRFDSSTQVAGYDPERYRELYDDAEGDTTTEKINALRRQYYDTHKAEIREQQREAYARNRRLHYGELNEIQTDRGVVLARRVDRYGYNNIYVDENVDLSERDLRKIDWQISEAKRVTGENSDANVIVTDIGDKLASYNPHTNTILMSTKMTSNDAIIKAQEGFASAEDPRSTAVHELFHWKDAAEYRKEYGEITDSTERSSYSVYQREKALQKLKEVGIDIEDYRGLEEISAYSLENALANNWEEVYTEYRTQKALSGGV